MVSTPRAKRAAPVEAGATEGEDAAGPSNAAAAVKPRRSSRKPPPQVRWPQCRPSAPLVRRVPHRRTPTSIDGSPSSSRHSLSPLPSLVRMHSCDGCSDGAAEQPHTQPFTAHRTIMTPSRCVSAPCVENRAPALGVCEGRHETVALRRLVRGTAEPDSL